MAWAAIGAAVASTVVGAGISAALAPGAPGAPDLGAASRAGVENDAANLDDQRRLEAAAQLGQSVTFSVGQPRWETVQVQYVLVNQPRTYTGLDGQQHTINVPQAVEYNPADFQSGGKYAGASYTMLPPRTEQRYISNQHTADFTGWGTADVQGKIAQQMAQIQLDLSKKYGSQFIDEALKELELSDPEGVAARKELYSQLQQQLNAKPDRPVANALNAQVSDEVKAGAGLTSEEDARLKDAIAKASVARGQAVSGDFAGSITGGDSGEQRLLAAIHKGNAWLSSGQTPEDVEYRRNQQNLANEGAFIAGQTPTQQFQQLQGAQNGPVPQVQSVPLSTPNPNAGQIGAQGAVLGYTQSLQNASMQANPWMAGIGTVLNGVSAGLNATGRTG